MSLQVQQRFNAATRDSNIQPKRSQRRQRNRTLHFRDNALT
jgi:hypothetical protein